MSERVLASADFSELYSIRHQLLQGGDIADEARKQLHGRLDTLTNEQVAGLIEPVILDSHTSLGNTHVLNQHISNLLANQDLSALVITTDLVGFKRINDTYGQRVGDDVIHLTALALQASIRMRPRSRNGAPQDMGHTDYFARNSGYRIGGDEYAAVLVGRDNLSHANPEAIARDKAKRMLGYEALQQYLADLPDEEPARQVIGVKGSYNFLDRDVDANFSDLLGRTDPKRDTKFEYGLFIDEDHQSFTVLEQQ